MNLHITIASTRTAKSSVRSSLHFLRPVMRALCYKNINAKFYSNESEIRNAIDRQQRLLYEANEVSEILKKLDVENRK